MLSRLIVLCAVGIFVLLARDGVGGGHLVSITISEYDYIIPIPCTPVNSSRWPTMKSSIEPHQAHSLCER